MAMLEIIEKMALEHQLDMRAARDIIDSLKMENVRLKKELDAMIKIKTTEHVVRAEGENAKKPY